VLFFLETSSPDNLIKNMRKTGDPRYLALLDPTNVILGVTVVIALGFLVWYSRVTVSLASANDELRKQASKTMNAEVGDGVPPFEAVDLRGEKINVDYYGLRKRLLFIISIGCPTCTEQIATWNEITPYAESRGYLVSLVSINSAEETNRFFAGKQQDFAVLTAVSPNLLRTYRVESFPQVMLISEHGEVTWVHIGVLKPEDVQSLRAKMAS